MEYPKMEPYIVYVQTDSSGYITAVNSSAFLTDTDGWTEIDSGYGDKYHHAQGNYFPQHIMTDSGVWMYKLVDGVPVECSAEEIAAQEKALLSFPTASRNIMAGEYITVDGVLYKATANIPNGGAIITGQNAEETTVEAQLYELTQKGE